MTDTTTIPSPNRNEFADVVAEAYSANWIKGNHKVSGAPAIDYDKATGRFSWGSSLNSVYSTEVRVDILEEGNFGELPEKYAKRTLRAYIAHHANQYWNTVLETIAADNDDNE